MVGSRVAFKSIALLLVALTLCHESSAKEENVFDDIEFATVEENTVNGEAHEVNAHRRLTWSIWSSLMYEIMPTGLCCAHNETTDNYEPRKLCPPPPPCLGPAGHDNPCCNSTSTADAYVDGDEEEAAWDADYEDGSDEASGEVGRSSVGASVMSNWWIFVLGAAAVGAVAAGIMMRKRRNDKEDDSDSALHGAVSNRAAALLGGGAAAAGTAAAAPPTFLNVPSMRRNPSGIEMDDSGAVLDQSPSTYYEMEDGLGGIDTSQLPDGVEVTESGNLAPYNY